MIVTVTYSGMKSMEVAWYSLTHSLTLTHSLSHSLTLSLTHLLTYSLTHLLTHSLFLVSGRVVYLGPAAVS